jgi:hypothetical protein
MSLLGEEVVEEWLNRNGYFTIRGIKIGVDEIDILAIRPLPGGKHECRHVEVQVSISRPWPRKKRQFCSFRSASFSVFHIRTRSLTIFGCSFIINDNLSR